MMEFTYNGMVRHGFGFYNPNHAAALMCAVFPFLWGWRRHASIGWGMSLILAIPLAMTFSRTGVLVLFFECVSFYFLSSRRHWKQMAAIGAGTAVVLLSLGVFNRFHMDRAVANRPEIWLAGLKLIGRNPQGVGLGHSGAVVSAFLLDGITCRTLVNAHLTLLAECGILVGFLWLIFMTYALLQGYRKPRSWCAFGGMCLSACNATIFDWRILTDFRRFGNYSWTNFALSWLLLLLFLAMGVYLSWGSFSVKRLACSLLASLIVVTVPFCFMDQKTPQVHDGIAYSSPDAPLVLYDGTWSLKTVLPYCRDGFRIPLEPKLCLVDAEEVMLFGNAAEYAGCFPKSRLVFVHPPEFFTPPANTVKIIVAGHDPRTWAFPVDRE